jgi:hypothetical protein
VARHRLKPLLAEEHARPCVSGHRLDCRQAGHAAGDQRQQDEAEENAAEKLGIRLNCRTHFENPRKIAAFERKIESP